ncbi:MAG TPA: nuclear transport factor 2 family protein [Solirubrobacteraceae bacterium]
MSAELIERLYGAMNAHDGEGMAACYADDAVFEDPAFGELRDGRVKDMWRMLCARAEDLTVDLREHDDASAHWVATYTFRTGRKVVNDIQARFAFGADGLISDHRDDFDLRRWAAQALGPPVSLLGYTPLLKPFIQRTTGKQLDAWRNA